MRIPLFNAKGFAKELCWLLLSILNVLLDVGVSIKPSLMLCCRSYSMRNMVVANAFTLEGFLKEG